MEAQEFDLRLYFSFISKKLWKFGEASETNQRKENSSYIQNAAEFYSGDCICWL